MAHSGDTPNRSTSVLEDAGEILRKLTPPTLATLLVVSEDSTCTQVDMADTIGVSRSSISKYLQTLSNLPLTLVTKRRNSRYTVTDDGKKVITLINEMVSSFDIDLHTLDWESDTAQEQVGACLAPLHGSRSDRTFFVLDALRVRSGSVNPYATPSRVWIEDVVHDVNTRSGNATTERVRQTLRRYVEAASIEFDDEYIILTDKGQDQAQVLDQLANQIEKQKEEEDASRIPSMDSIEKPETGDLSGQMRRHGFHGGGQRAVVDPSASVSHKLPTIVPAYCLSSAAHEDTHTQSPLPVLPLAAMTIKELTDAVDRLSHEYNEDMRVEPYWTLQTESGLFPLGPAQLSPSSDVL